jgi:acetolactate synthase I/II/III large subunit
LVKLSDYVIDFVARRGVKHLFLLPGGGAMHLIDSAGANSRIEYICCLHEQACAFAAEAYAEYGNQLGVALVTSGPGGTNTVTGVAAAWVESASCLFISGQAKRSDLIGTRGVRSMGQQELDIVSIVRPITKYAVTVTDPGRIRYELEKAVYLATNGRQGPVWIDIPLDVQASVIDETTLLGYCPEPATEPAGPLFLQGAVAAAIRLLNEAERPVAFIGNGVRSSSGLLRRFLDVLKIPVLTTWKVIDLFPESDALCVGRPGAIGQRGANFSQQNSDCLLILGARLDLPQTAFDHRNFARAAKRIMVDIDAAEIRKMQTEINVPICADAGAFLEEFFLQSDQLKPQDRTRWLAKCKEWQKRYPVVLGEYWDETGFVNVYVLMDVLSDLLLENDVIVPGSSGPCSDIFMQAFRVKPGQRVVNAPGLGAMGTGLPGAIGACLASGRKRTICVNGDGGFQLNIQELETVRRLDLPIKFFVLSNGAYASIMAMQRSHFQGRLVASDPSSHLTFPDITKVARGYGIATAEIRSHVDIKSRILEVLSQPGPVVCAVTTSPDQPTAPRVTSVVREDGVIISRPMEDMWPILSREELRENMMVPPLDDSGC